MNRKDLSVARSDLARRVFALIGALSSATPAYVAAAQTTSGPQYGYCSAQTADQKKVYISALFEMPMEDIAAHNTVMKAEFDKMLLQKYGSPAGPNEARSGGCAIIWNVSKAAAEEKRQLVFAAARHDNAQIFDTGWTFVRAAQTPPAGPPVGKY